VVGVGQGESGEDGHGKLSGLGTKMVQQECGQMAIEIETEIEIEIDAEVEVEVVTVLFDLGTSPELLPHSARPPSIRADMTLGR